MEITRRSFLAGIGSVTVGLLFRRKLDAVLDSLERDLVAEQQADDQAPSGADIIVVPQRSFLPERLVVASAIAPLFVIENIQIGGSSQFAANAGPVPASIFAPDAVDVATRLDVVAPGTEIRFRVRYVGAAPGGSRFYAALLGVGEDGARLVLPIASHVPIVG
jgi:hypothetical protein